MNTKWTRNAKWASGVAALAIAAGAYAQPPDGAGGPPPKGPRGPMAADANSDGKVTFEELTAKDANITRDRFNEMDKDKDGVLSKEDRPQRGPGGPGGPGDGPHGDGPHGPGMRDGEGPHGPGGPGGPGGRLREADADKDGKVSLEEAKKALPDMTDERFKKMDKNSDGFLTPEDRPARPEGGPDGPGGPGGPGGDRGERGQRFREADTDKDGKLSLEEAKKAFPDMTDERFKERDKNGDGFLSREDRPEGAGGPGGPGGPDGPGRGPGGRLREADTDKDGKVSFAEAQKAIPDMTQERFDRMDRNSDGFITPEDRPSRPAGRPDAPPPAGETPPPPPAK
jgi:Ca2+-binding EF-hand superfamily protein